MFPLPDFMPKEFQHAVGKSEERFRGILTISGDDISDSCELLPRSARPNG
eukprot:gene8555-134_t